MRLLVPQTASKGSKLITPFSDEYSSLGLQETAILEGKPVRMMGVFEHEIEEVSQNNMKPDLRIRGFDEEEERLGRRLLNTLESHLKLPQGPYVFGGFRTLHIPGIELNPPPSEALRRMHMLACDPGIIAIMNKHRWRVGIMTELAPVGYVGISPKCLLGFNKNCGEEISLRLRTDDLKGFRKYESIKKTLLHELAHMVYSEHDADFYALDKQLNHEAASLDWTRSGSRTLSGHKVTNHYANVLQTSSSSQKSFQKLGGGSSSGSTNARESSVAAAYSRFLNASNGLEGQLQVEDINAIQLTENVHEFSGKKQILNVVAEPNPDDSEMEDPDDNALVMSIDDMQVDAVTANNKNQSISPVPGGLKDPDPGDSLHNRHMFEPDPDDGLNNRFIFEPDPDDSLVVGNANSQGEHEPDNNFSREESHDEPDLDDSEGYKTDVRNEMRHIEPNPDDSGTKNILMNPIDNIECSSDGLRKRDVKVEPDPDDSTDEVNKEELHRIEEPVAVMCKRLQKAIEMLRSEASPVDATSSLQTLVKIIRNVIDHPDEAKFRRLRKANPLFQRNVANFKGVLSIESYAKHDLGTTTELNCPAAKVLVVELQFKDVSSISYEKRKGHTSLLIPGLPASEDASCFMLW